VPDGIRNFEALASIKALQASMMGALLDLKAKRPYCIDPTREYSPVYLDGNFAEGNPGR